MDFKDLIIDSAIKAGLQLLTEIDKDRQQKPMKPQRYKVRKKQKK